MMGATHAMPHFKTEKLRLYVYKTAKCRLKQLTGFWFGLYGVTPLSTIFQLYRGDQSVLFLKETRVPGENH